MGRLVREQGVNEVSNPAIKAKAGTNHRLLSSIDMTVSMLSSML
jgi:hypothetical protein